MGPDDGLGFDVRHNIFCPFLIITNVWGQVYDIPDALFPEVPQDASVFLNGNLFSCTFNLCNAYISCQITGLDPQYMRLQAKIGLNIPHTLLEMVCH